MSNGAFEKWWATRQIVGGKTESVTGLARAAWNACEEARSLSGVRRSSESMVVSIGKGSAVPGTDSGPHHNAAASLGAPMPALARASSPLGSGDEGQAGAPMEPKHCGSAGEPQDDLQPSGLGMLGSGSTPVGSTRSEAAASGETSKEDSGLGSDAQMQAPGARLGLAEVQRVESSS